MMFVQYAIDSYTQTNIQIMQTVDSVSVFNKRVISKKIFIRSFVLIRMKTQREKKSNIRWCTFWAETEGDLVVFLWINEWKSWIYMLNITLMYEQKATKRKKTKMLYKRSFSTHFSTLVSQFARCTWSDHNVLPRREKIERKKGFRQLSSSWFEIKKNFY